MFGIEFTGNVTRDATLRVTQNGVSVCDFTVAINDRFDRSKDPMYIKVSAWRKLAETCGKNIKQGMKVYVRGDTLVASPYTSKDGGKTKVSLDITAVDVEIQNWGKKESSSDEYAEAYTPRETDNAPVASNGFTAVETDELPF